MAQRELKHKAALHPCVEARQSSDLLHLPQPVIHNQTSEPQLPEGDALSRGKQSTAVTPGAEDGNANRRPALTPSDKQSLGLLLPLKWQLLWVRISECFGVSRTYKRQRTRMVSPFPVLVLSLSLAFLWPPVSRTTSVCIFVVL